MSIISEHITNIRRNIPQHVSLICVSKYHPISAIQEAYDAGERDFGESRVQEMVNKYQQLPQDIRWHMIGHLQTNKVRDIISFVHLIHSVDSLRLLETINKEAARIGRIVNVLLEVHVAQEKTKSGFDKKDVENLITDIENKKIIFNNVQIVGLMTMATNTNNKEEVRRCFQETQAISAGHSTLQTLSLGMSNDYPIALEEGSTMVRIGSAIFGERQ